MTVADSAVLKVVAPAAPRRAVVLRRLLRHRLAVTALLVLLTLAAVSFSAPLWLPQDHILLQVRAETFADPAPGILFGRDEFGRDAFARAVYGGQISLWVAFASAVLATAIGMVLGMVAGYFGGWIDGAVDRIIELFLTLPYLLLLILAAAIARPSVSSIVLILGIFGWPVLARIVRGEYLAARQRDYIQAAETVGCSWLRIAVRHILPNALAPIIVSATLLFATNLTAEAGISFLGLGIQPPTPSWGNMLTNAQNYMISAPFLAIFPGLLILVTVLCVNLLGDGLRDAFDPRLRH
ncbi:MAG: ABC transporter permease [Dehalococcoidia bacterium]